MNMGLKLMVERKKRGNTQKDIGKLINVSEQTISLYERGKALPRPTNMKKLAKYFGVSVEELFFDDGEEG